MCEDQRKYLHILLGLSDANIDTVISRFDTNILPSDIFLDGLTPEHASDTKQSCLIAFALARRVILEERRLGMTLDILSGLDNILSVSTGAGNYADHPPMLLQPGSIFITTSPLKWLVVSQAEDLRHYGLQAAIVNEGISHDLELFNTILDGYYNHVRISPSNYDDTSTAQLKRERLSLRFL